MRNPVRLLALTQFLREIQQHGAQTPTLTKHPTSELLRRVQRGEKLTDAELATIKISELGLSVHASNCLQSAGVTNLAELKKQTWSDLRRIPDLAGADCSALLSAAMMFKVHIQEG